MARVGIYPGTFDPVTNGHVDIISRAARLVDHLVVAVAINDGKGPLFSIEDRVALVEQALAAAPIGAGYDGPMATIEVRPFEGLLMHFAEEQGANVIVRGLRAVSDFEYEFQMVGMNARLNHRINTVFLMASEGCQFISSRFVKEIGRLGGDISTFVPKVVVKALHERLGLK
jgi:pantetheine-phosphate adenylyltransferase